jgi:ATP/maltotriose-dependent transcriptional regulator MalT
MAHAANDHQLGAHVFGSLSHLAHHNRQPDQAIVYARQGHQRLAAGRPHPGVQARLCALQARGHAAVGDPDACATQLRQAERALATSADEPASEWVSTFDGASLATEAARCLRQLGHLDAARRQAEQVIELRPPQRARSRAFAHLILVSILITQGKPEEACAVAHDVLRTTRALGSYLVVQQLEELDRLLAPYRRSRDVAAFLECLHDELRERRWLIHWLPPAEPAQPGTAP